MQVVTVGMSGVDRLKLECGAGNDLLHGGERGMEGAKLEGEKLGAGAGVSVAEEGEVLGVLRGDIGEGSGAEPTDHHPTGTGSQRPSLFATEHLFTNGSVFLVSRKGLTGELPGDG